MYIKQISVFLENQAGRLYDVMTVLADNNINLRALFLTDSSDFGILRLIVDKPDDCLKVLKESQFTVNITNVIAIEVPDHAGGLSGVLKEIYAADLNIEYMYAFVEKHHDNAVLIFRFESAEAAIKKLKDKNLKIMSNQSVLAE
ncbi:MAG: amino acid-binding protein [Deltaproteobacteria bacterium]|jgi:hypothetical protein|nr:amino acid-binding protein [Deltaproteobacteria bacterium]